jgi:hypothetical protein
MDGWSTLELGASMKIFPIETVASARFDDIGSGEQRYDTLTNGARP